MEISTTDDGMIRVDVNEGPLSWFEVTREVAEAIADHLYDGPIWAAPTPGSSEYQLFTSEETARFYAKNKHEDESLVVQFLVKRP